MTKLSTERQACVVFDVDGTLAFFDVAKLGHLVHSEEKQWQAFHDAMASAPIIEPVARLLNQLKAAGEIIVICSGRPVGWIDATCAWLDQSGLAYDAVYLRPDGSDHWPDPKVKKLLLAQMREDGYEPWIVVDDRSSVVEAWREEGLVCLQCAPGDF